MYLAAVFCPECAAGNPPSKFEQLCENKKNEIIAFTHKQLADEEMSRQEDFWEAFNDTIDVQFWISDDEQSQNFNKREVWAYEIVSDFRGKRGESYIDTSDGILITVI